MNKESKWQQPLGKCALALGAGALAAMVAGPALAGCGLYYPLGTTQAQQKAPPRDEAKLMPAVYRPGSGGFIRVGLGAETPNNGIAGLWKVTFVSDGVPPNPVPAGVVTDFGTVQWHDDGTEIMVSGGRPPSTGDVCMGAWEQIGRFTYKLKHIALAWISSDTPPSMGGPGPSPAQFLGPATISEVVTLSKSRDSYAGTFAIDQYNADESAVLVHVSGTITGTRVTPD